MFRAFAVRLPHVGATIAVLALAACTQPSPPSNQSTKAPPPTYDIVAQIRAAGDRDKSAIEVAPLRDPGVTGLQDGASADERAQQYDAAGAKLDSALKIAGDAPDLLQDRAEIYVRQRDYKDAEKLARHSYEIGPKLGSLCARNWQTVVEMRLQAQDEAGAANARQELAKCHQAGPVRM
jgi:tetratricopeptide (TPR) repeat protein